jgi:hypothetical protein
MRGLNVGREFLLKDPVEMAMLSTVKIYYRLSICYPKFLGPEVPRVSDFVGFWNICVL